MGLYPLVQCKYSLWNNNTLCREHWSETDPMSVQRNRIHVIVIISTIMDLSRGPNSSSFDNKILNQ